MRKPTLPVYQPLGELVVGEIFESTVSLESRRVRAQVSVIAADLFRLRMTSAGHLSERPSWAVCKTDWPAVPTDIRTSRTEVCLQSSSGKLTFRLADGSWRLHDRSGSELFASAPEATGFAKQGAQLTLRLAEGESLFGLGETTGTFDKRGLIREFWNIDVLGHAPAIHPSLRTLYISIPFAISLRAGRAAGIFWDNPARQTWDLGQTKLDRWQMKAASGEIDLYLFVGPQVSEVVARYTELTGRIPLPPRWALGYQQCRYSYETRARIEQVAKDFRGRKIPCDVLYLDIHHMDGYRVFTFGKRFPAAAALMAKLARRGFKVVTIVDPGVKDDSRFGVLKRGIAAKAFVKAPNLSTDFIGTVWPGKSRFPDFLNARVRQWWGTEQRQLTCLGIAGFWNDMNEPANFGSPTKTLPDECVHDTDFGPMTHAEAHNLYGMQMARASREGALAHEPNRRPFIITRAGYAGVQRYALAWTGDNSSIWEHLSDSVQMLLNLSVSGLAFCGGDVGGFIDNTTPELLARWTQMAAFTPFFRNHSNIKTIDQEPWALGPRAQAICLECIQLRYRLLPYLYGLFVEAHRLGTPIMRPLFWHYQHDPVAVATGNQFMLGRDLLVAPIMRQGAVVRSVYLPRGRWFDYWTGECHIGERHIVAEAPLERIPLFTRAGSIIPMGPIQQYVGENETGVIDLHIWPGARGTLNWYEDDGSSMAYAKGYFHQRDLSFIPDGDGGALYFGASQGSFSSQIRTWRVTLHAAERGLKATVDSRKLASRFDRATHVLSFEIPNSETAAKIRIQ